ncbi:phosphatase PAP2 family protein [Natrialba taiwanensis]|uniref:PA-phosphatase-like phosphoesterase n=1 Tax=Natrialba taiwanensis DSM 12281 TaxID=1230458 RepID=M0A065_9EURY|nr:phosphatase PAP2 family protein [Natrialba taiwanensis]ELY90778.1 PA-phosphatase-like phosphoesterase [Natrialba taiwanensis DSM 12281]
MNRNVGFTELIRDGLPEWAVPAFECIALLGDKLVVVGVLALVTGSDAYGRATRDYDRLVSDRAAFVLAVVLGGLALTLLLKTVFGLPRPPSSLQAVPRSGEGFPSGHAMAATVLWGALAVWSAYSTRRRRLAGAALVIGLVAFSRLALGVHYLVDVLASIGFGVGYLLVAAWATDGEPERAFAGTAVLGGLTVIATGGTDEGWIAFGSCVGGATGWWMSTRPRVRKRWLSAIQ